MKVCIMTLVATLPWRSDKTYL